MVLPGDQLTVKIRHIGMSEVTWSSNSGDLQWTWWRFSMVPPTRSPRPPSYTSLLVKVRKSLAWIWISTTRLLLHMWSGMMQTLIYVLIPFHHRQGQHEAEDDSLRWFSRVKHLPALLDMTYYTTDEDGNVKTFPPFTDIDTHTPKYTFSHPNSLLFATQFSQIALVTEKASLEDMCTKGSFKRIALLPVTRSVNIQLLPPSPMSCIFLSSSMLSFIVALPSSVQSNVMRTTGPTSMQCASSTLITFWRPPVKRQCVRLWSTRTGTLLEIVNYNVKVSMWGGFWELYSCSIAGSTIHLC